MLIDEELLIEQSKQGDLESFTQLIKNYQHKVYNIAFRFMGNENDAKDLAQEALIKLYKNIDKFRGECSFSTWLYHITSNVCRDELRKRTKAKVVSLDETYKGEKAMKIEPTSEAGNPEVEYERVEVKDKLQKLLNQLTPDQRLIIVMREVQGLSYEEMAGVLQCSLGTVKSRLSRARQALKTLVIEHKEQFGSTAYIS